MHLITRWFGTFLMDGAQIHAHRLFPGTATEISKRMLEISEGKILDEEQELAREAQAEGRIITVEEKRLHELGEVVEPGAIERSNADVDTDIDTDAEAEVSANANANVSVLFREPDPSQFGIPPGLLHEAALLTAKIESRADIAVEAPIIQAVNAYDELTKTQNLLLERLREWYGLHFPELAEVVKDEQYIKLIMTDGAREQIQDHHPELAALGETSIGAEFGEEDIAILQHFAELLASVAKELDTIEHYIGRKMEASASNMRDVAGPMIGARLIASAGSQERLARLPSSTIQLLGAERAMFRHLRDHSPPPKHGVIFQHPSIHRAPYWQRGHISRALSGKLAIAAKMDYFGTDNIGEELNLDLARRIEEIQKKYPDPPPRQTTAAIKKRGPRTEHGRTERKGGKKRKGHRRGGARGKKRKQRKNPG